MNCTKDPTLCGKCVIGLANWDKDKEKYLSEFPACVDPLCLETISMENLCPNSPFPDGRLPEDNYRQLFPTETVFRYVLNDDGEPIQVLHGNSAVYYNKQGKRVEKPVVFVKAKDWPAAKEIIRGWKERCK